MRVDSHSRRKVRLPAHFSERFLIAFHTPGFRWLWVNTVFDSIYRTVDIVAQGWLVLTLTDSPFWVGAAAGIRGISILLLSPFAGVIADRLDRRRLLRLLQLSMSAIAFLIAYLVVTGRIEVWHIMVLSFLNGGALALIMTVRWTLTIDLVGKRALLNANSANFMAFSFMQIISPVVGGVIITIFGIWAVYLLMGSALMAATLVTLLIPIVPIREKLKGSPWRDLKEGVYQVFLNPVLRPLFFMAVVVGVFGYSYNYMLPVMARDVLKVGATGLGLMASVGGAGSLITIFVIANLGDVRNKGRLMVLGSAGYGVFLVLFSASPWFPVSLFLIAAVKAASMLYDSMMTTLLQTSAPDEMRGRVMSSYALTFGMSPLGGLQAGAIAGFLGAPVAIGIGGVLVCLNALRMTRLMPRFRQKEEEVRLEDSLKGEVT